MSVATITELAVNSSTTVYGQSLTLTATVADLYPATGTPTGFVAFYDSGNFLNGISLTSAGPSKSTGSITLSNLVVGTHSIQAVFTGSSNFNPSSSVGTINTVAGVGSSGYNGDNIPANSAALNQPFSTAVDASGNIFIADTYNSRVREVVKATGNIITFAGGGSSSANGVLATSAALAYPTCLAIDSSGNVYIGDEGNNLIRKVTTDGKIATIAGGGGSTADGIAATAALINGPHSLALDASGNLYIADLGTDRLRKVTAADGKITTVAGGGSSTADGIAATAASLFPFSVAVDGSGNLYIADLNSNRLRKVTAADGKITTVAGGGSALNDNIPATTASISPVAIAMDAAGNIFLFDQNTDRVREVVKATGNITTVAGNGSTSYNGDNIAATSAGLGYSYGIATDPLGNLFIADLSYSRIRKVGMPAVVTVSKAPLTVTPVTTIRAYGVADPTLTVAYSGFVNGEGPSALGGTLSIVDAQAATTTGVGSYAGAITASGQTSSNYTITYVPGNLTVIAAPLTITPRDASSQYGPTIGSFNGYTTTGLKNGETVGFVNLASTGRVVGAQVGSYGITASGASGGTFNAANYNIAYGIGTFTVTPSILLIKANNASKNYGQAVTFAGTEFTATGLYSVFGDSITGVTLTSTGAPATAAVAGSPYPIAISNAVGSRLTNYTITYTNGNLTVNAVPLTVTPVTTIRAYGDADPTLTVAYSGFVNGEGPSALGGTLSIVDAQAVTTTGVGSYAGAITASGQTSSNYTITYAPGNLTVVAAPLSITSSSYTKTYGTAQSVGGFTSIGLKNGESVGSVTVIASGGLTVNSPVGVYALTPSAATGGTFNPANYAITYNTGSLTVNQVALLIKANNASKVYGQTLNFAGTEFSTVGLVVGDSVTGVTLISAGAAPTAAGAGSPYPITPSSAAGSGLTNYSITYSDGALTVTAAPLTVTANNVSRVYGSPDPVLGVTYNGFVNGETSAVLGGTLSVVDSQSAPSTGVGNYTGVITAFGQTSTNYSISYLPGNLTVTTAPLTVSASNQSKTYGQTVNFAGTEFTTLGLLNSDTVTGVTLNSAGAAATAGVAGSPYPITASSAVGSGLTNYSITYSNGTLTVTTAPLTITANDSSKTYGQTVNFAGTEFTTSGLLNGDSVNSVVLTSTGSPASAGVVGSPYPILIDSATGSGLSNYSINFTTGQLAVTKAHLTTSALVSVGDIGHGDIVPTPTATFSGFVNGDPASVVSGTPGFTGLPTTSSPAGIYPISPTTGGLSADNYDFPTVVSTALNVHPKITDILVKWGTKTLSILNLNRDLPFTNITGLEVKFSDPVDITGSGLGLMSTAGGPSYSPVKVGSGLGTNDVTWNLSTIGIDRLMLALDQTNVAATAATSLKLFGLTGRAFNVLPGDYNGDGVVSSADMTGVNNATVMPYDVFADLNGDGVVDANDVKVARAKIGTKLPTSA